MPNHFHLIVKPFDSGCVEKGLAGNKTCQILPFAMGKMMSSYTQAINKQNGTVGSLFQQRTKAKSLAVDKNTGISYLETAIHYIHQNPLRAGLVSRMEDWPYSSFQDFAKMKSDSLCDVTAVFEVIDLTPENFYSKSYEIWESYKTGQTVSSFDL